MKKHEILSPQSRAALFDPPTDPAAIVRHYTFSPEDMALIRQRRRAANRLGFAVHLAYLTVSRPRARRQRKRRLPTCWPSSLRRLTCEAEEFDVLCATRAKRAGSISANFKPISTFDPFRRDDRRAVAQVAH